MGAAHLCALELALGSGSIPLAPLLLCSLVKNTSILIRGTLIRGVHRPWTADEAAGNEELVHLPKMMFVEHMVGEWSAVSPTV